LTDQFITGSLFSSARLRNSAFAFSKDSLARWIAISSKDK
jgi:hypothetical protein